MEEMPRKSAAELEAECLRLLAMDPHTRGIKRVEIIRTYPKGTGPNWTYGAESEAKRPAIPTEGGQRFRSKAATQSERRRPPC